VDADPTPSPTPPDSQAAASEPLSPLEIAEQGVDESVSRFIGRLHEQIRTLTQQRDRYAAAIRRLHRHNDSLIAPYDCKCGLINCSLLAALEENDE
jgi:hypothetical protein